MPKLIDHDERRNHIIDVTWNLVLKGGIEAATMREIAKEAGFANGALKHYFASKDMIIEQTFDRAMKMVESHPSASDGDARGLAALRGLCAATLPLDDERVTAGRVLLAFWELSLSNENLRRDYLGHLGSWRKFIGRFLAEGREDGDIVTETPDDELVDEMVLITAGANVMTLVGPEFTTPDLMQRHLERYVERLTRP